ncbi:MAG: arylsulfatase [Planctomycetota bacterium]|nr:arylsulfatase [Planctomycetota bacterium]
MPLRHAPWLILALATTALAAPRPNIILIMSDDMGYSDIGCYGSEVATPTLDKLAADGLRFTQFYNTGRCCPTRASLMTGLYPHQAGIGHMMNDRGHPGYRGDLNNRCVTIAQVLGTSGYRCYMTGKWHITKTVRPTNEMGKHNWPRQRGFDRFYGTIHGAGSFFDPNSLTRDNTLIAPADPDNYYYTDAISDNAAKFITEHDDDSPFFMYVAYTAAHWPMHAKPVDIAKYKGRYDKGWDVLRDERFARMREMGLLDRAWPLSPNVQDWDQAKNKPWQRARMEVYAAMIDSMDQGISRIVGALKKSGQFDNTLVLFLQDNGGCQEEFGSNGAVRPKNLERQAAMKPGELQFSMVPRISRDGRPVRQGFGVMPGPTDTYVAYGIQWANASNTPFREYKHYVHEGGISTPLIAHWPKGIRERGGFRHEPGHLVDIMATCVDLAGARYPAEWKKSPVRPMEGKSLVPVFGGQDLPDRPLYWEHEGNRAVRVGDWKLVAKGRSGPWELYNLKADRSELKNLVKTEAERAKTLETLWDTWAVRANVLPWPNSGNTRKTSNKKLTRLKAGAKLPQDGGVPNVKGRGFTVSVTIKQPGDGVLVGHGGTAHGWSLWIKSGKPVFSFRRNSKLTELKSPDVLGKARTVSARVGTDGSLVLLVGDREVARGKAAGALTQVPQDGLEVGQDLNGAVGGYKAPNRFNGQVAEVTIRLKK